MTRRGGAVGDKVSLRASAKGAFGRGEVSFFQIKSFMRSLIRQLENAGFRDIADFSPGTGHLWSDFQHLYSYEVDPEAQTADLIIIGEKTEDTASYTQNRFALKLNLCTSTCEPGEESPINVCSVLYVDIDREERAYKFSRLRSNDPVEYSWSDRRKAVDKIARWLVNNCGPEIIRNLVPNQSPIDNVSLSARL